MGFEGTWGMSCLAIALVLGQAALAGSAGAAGSVTEASVTEASVTATPEVAPVPDGSRVIAPEPAAARIEPDAPHKAGPGSAAGLDGMLTAALQLGAACGTYAVGLPVLAVASYPCAPMGCTACMLPAAAGYLGTFVGDRFGSSRAPALWPMVAAYAGVILFGGVGVVIAYWGVFANNPLISAGGGLTMLVGILASAAGIPAAYALTAEDKLPGDDGSALPGILEAGHPRAPPKGTKKPAERVAPPRPPPPELPELPPPPLLEPQGLTHAMGF